MMGRRPAENERVAIMTHDFLRIFCCQFIKGCIYIYKHRQPMSQLYKGAKLGHASFPEAGATVTTSSQCDLHHEREQGMEKKARNTVRPATVWNGYN